MRAELFASSCVLSLSTLTRNRSPTSTFFLTSNVPPIPPAHLFTIRSYLPAFTPPALPPPHRLNHQLGCLARLAMARCRGSPWRWSLLVSLLRHSGPAQSLCSISLRHGHLLRHRTSWLHRRHGLFPTLRMSKPTVAIKCFTAFRNRRVTPLSQVTSQQSCRHTCFSTTQPRFRGILASSLCHADGCREAALHLRRHDGRSTSNLLGN